MARNPNYSPYLDYAPTFKWGGREWGPDDAAAFRKKLGKRYGAWARKHPTAARVFDPIEQDIYSTFQPQLSAIDFERKQRQAFYDRQARNLQGFATALMPFLQGIGPAIGGAYGEGAETMSSLGTGYGDVLTRTGAADAARANETLAAINAPEGQLLSESGDAGAALAGVAGWVPSQMMGEQGRAHAAAAAQLPHTASLEAQLMLKSLMNQAAEEDKGFSQEILQVLQGMPGARTQLREQRNAAALEKQAFKLKQLESERDFWLKKKALALKVGDFQLAQQAEERAQQAEKRRQMESAGRDYWGNPMPGYTELPNGTLLPPNYRVDKNGNVVKKETRGPEGFTPGQRQDMLNRIDSQEDKIVEMIVAALKVGDWAPTDAHDRRSVQDRRSLGRRIFKEFQHLAPTPETKRRLRNLIARLLATTERAGQSGKPSGSKTLDDILASVE